MDASSSALSDDLSDYDVISEAGHASADDFDHIPAQVPTEPTIPQAAREKFYTASLSPENIQAYVRKALGSNSAVVGGGGGGVTNGHTIITMPIQSKTMRVYVDGIFDGFSVGHALQLRQAKLSFPSVYLMVGIFSDDTCRSYESHTSVPHVERCEVVRHCRWVDEVIPDAPWLLEKDQLVRWRINYVAFDEGTSVDPAFDKTRLKAYDALKSMGKVIPTRRTIGLVRTPTRLCVPITPTQTSNPATPVGDPAALPNP